MSRGCLATRGHEDIDLNLKFTDIMQKFKFLKASAVITVFANAQVFGRVCL